MPVLSESEGRSQLREKLCAEGIPNSLCPTRSAQESRQTIDEYVPANTDRLPIDRPINDVISDKTTRPTTTEKTTTKQRRTNPAELLLEAEVEERMNSNPFADVPTPVLEAELKRRRREADSGDVTEAELDALSARVFGREIKETGEQVTETGDTEPTDDELDKLSASIFGRQEATA